MQIRPWLAWTLIPATLAAGVACKPRVDAGSGLRNIYGDDDRAIVSESGYPYAAIGRLEKRDGFCTATLVGPSLVLTASHCLIDDATGQPSSAVTSYRANFVLGQSRASANIKGFYHGTRQPVRNRKRDWAIIKLDRRLDGEIKPLELRTVDFEAATLPYKLNLAAFHFDIGGGLILYQSGDNCGIRSMDSKMTAADVKVKGRLYHDCDMVAGASGAPMFNMSGETAYIEAINTSESTAAGMSNRHDEYTDTNPNYAIPLQDAAKMLEALRAASEDDVNNGKVRMDGVFFSRVGLANAASCVQFQAGQGGGGGQPGQQAPSGTPTFVPVTSAGKQLKTSGAKAGLSQEQCQQTLRSQANGLVCTAGNKGFAIVRAGDVQAFGEDGDFDSFEDCTRTVALSTARYVCAANSADRNDAKRFVVRRLSNIGTITATMKLDDCITKARELETARSEPPPPVTPSGKTVACEKNSGGGWGPMFDTDFAVKDSNWPEESCRHAIANSTFGYVCVPCKTEGGVAGTQIYSTKGGAGSFCSPLSAVACAAVTKRAAATGVCAPKVTNGDLLWYIMNQDGTSIWENYSTFQECVAVLN